MMTFDDERERAFERKFAFDQELAFKVAAQRNALLGRWVAQRMRLDTGVADAYVAGLQRANPCASIRNRSLSASWPIS